MYVCSRPSIFFFFNSLRVSGSIYSITNFYFLPLNSFFLLFSNASFPRVLCCISKALYYVLKYFHIHFISLFSFFNNFALLGWRRFWSINLNVRCRNVDSFSIVSAWFYLHWRNAELFYYILSWWTLRRFKLVHHHHEINSDQFV